MLSASDAGRIGRLVLPKKCAEVSTYALCALTHFYCSNFYAHKFLFRLKYESVLVYMHALSISYC